MITTHKEEQQKLKDSETLTRNLKEDIAVRDSLGKQALIVKNSKKLKSNLNE